MANTCCESACGSEATKADPRWRRILWVALIVNAAMFLVEMLAQRQTFTPELERRVTDMDLLSSFDVDHIETDALLFQAGYLTLRGVEQILPGEWIYTLGYPNREVRTSLNKALMLHRIR